jgi:Uncharacterized protein conserved in bacteria (DUF2188)
MTAATPSPAQSTPAGATADPDRYVETYFADGVWNSRRHDSDRPFASGEVKTEQIAVGAEVARWNQIRHIVRHADGTVEVTR